MKSENASVNTNVFVGFRGRFVWIFTEPILCHRPQWLYPHRYHRDWNSKSKCLHVVS